MHVKVYSKPDCHLCEDALQIIDRLTAEYGLDVTEVNILDDMAAYEQYKEIIPVVEVTDVRVGRVVAPITEPELHAYFKMARHAIEDRHADVLDVEIDQARFGTKDERAGCGLIVWMPFHVRETACSRNAA